jgi:hypothetical protein
MRGDLPPSIASDPPPRGRHQWGLSLMARAPVDLAAFTRDVRNRFSWASGNLEIIAQSTDPIFSDPRQVTLELVLVQHEIEAAISVMRRGWWP